MVMFCVLPFTCMPRETEATIASRVPWYSCDFAERHERCLFPVLLDSVS